MLSLLSCCQETGLASNVTGIDDHCSTIEQSTSAVISIPSFQLLSNHRYNITLLVSKAGRVNGTMTQHVRLVTGSYWIINSLI